MLIVPSSLTTNLWYRGDATSVVLSYFAESVSPHAQTVRASYTVPSGHAAFLHTTQLMFMRTNTATTPGRVFAFMNISIGGTPKTVFMLDLITNTLNVNERFTAPCGLLLPSGTVTLQTTDGSVGGSGDYFLSALLTQFPTN